MKKHAPRKQLLEAGKLARDLLVEKGLILPREKSAVDTILATKGAPKLPGIPAYVPYPWTIHHTRRVLYDLAREYQLTLKNGKAKDSITEFFKFVVRGLNEEQGVVGALIRKTVEEKRYDRKFLIMKDTLKAVEKFLVDSFAISVIESSSGDIASYMEWFLNWSESLLGLWPEYYRKVDAPKKSNAKGLNLKS